MTLLRSITISLRKIFQSVAHSIVSSLNAKPKPKTIVEIDNDFTEEDITR